MRRRLGVAKFESLRTRVMKARKEEVEKEVIIKKAINQYS